jgi:hypothetical protein
MREGSGGIRMMKRRSPHRTQWTAQFAVASELCKRDYQVALTLGNHPVLDLMVVSPTGVAFCIDVKGQYRKNFWPVTPKEQRKDLFYVLALVPDDDQNRFFILTQDEANADVEKNTIAWKTRNSARANLDDRWPGVSQTCAAQHEGRWDKLPR